MKTNHEEKEKHWLVSVPQTTPKGNIRWHDFEVVAGNRAEAKRKVASRAEFHKHTLGLRGHLSTKASEYKVSLIPGYAVKS